MLFVAHSRTHTGSSHDVLFLYLANTSVPTTSDRMAIIESFASFRDRAIQFGIDEADVTILKDKKFASFGAFTFIAIYNPNSADDATLKAALAHVLGRDITIEDMARFRRLHFESNAITISDARRRTEATSESTESRKTRRQQTRR